jgi:hypothetical protein
MKVTRDDKKRLIKIIPVLVTILVFLWGIKAIWKSWKSTGNLLYQVSCLLKNQEKALQQKDIAAAEVASIISRLKDINTKIWPSKTPQLAFSSFLADIETISHKCRMHILSKSTLPPTKIGLYYQIPITLSLRCESESLTHFLYALRTAPKLYHLSFLSISPQENDQLLQVFLVINSWQKEAD